MARYIDADVLIKNIANIQDLRTLSTKTIGEAISATPTAAVVEIKDCYKCKWVTRHAGQYPCSCCRNCYTDKFEPKERE